MATLPASTDFTNADRTQAQAKSFITDLRAYLAGLFGAAGTTAEARSTLGLGNSATLGVGTTAGTVAAGDHSHNERVASDIHAAAAKTPLVDADELGLWDSVSTALRKVSWANVKATFIATINIWSKPQRTTRTTDNDGSFDCDANNDFECTTAGAITFTFTNIPAAPAVQKGTVKLVSSHTVSLHSTTKATSGLAALLSTPGTYMVAYETDGTNSYISCAGAMA